MSKKRLGTQIFVNLALSALLALTTASAQAQSDGFSIKDNKLQISGGSGTTFSSQTPTIDADGVVGTIIDVPSTNGVGIPSFSFELVTEGTVPNGSYDFRVGVTFDDDANQRRMEAKIDKLTLTVSGTAPNQVVTGTIPAGGNTMRVLARNGNNTFTVDVSVANDKASGPISVSGGTVSFNASTLIDRIRSSANSVFDTYILQEFNQEATYTYRIAVLQLAGAPATLTFGTKQPAFTPLKKIGVDFSAPDNFFLKSNTFTADFNQAQRVSGQFNVKFIASSGGGGGGGGSTTTNVTQGTTNLTNEVANIVVPSANATPEQKAAAATAANTAITNTNDLLTSANAQITAGTATPTQVLLALSAGGDAINKAADVKAAGGTGVSTETTNTAITNVANLIGALATSTTLTTAQKDEVTTVVTNTVTGATKLITSDTPRSTLLSLVEATSKLLKSTSDATGEIKEALATQLKALGEGAGKAIVATLPDTIKGNIDITSVDAIRALVSASPTAKSQVIQSQPNLYGAVANSSGSTVNAPTVSRTVTTANVSNIATHLDAMVGNIGGGGLGGGFGGGGFGSLITSGLTGPQAPLSAGGNIANIEGPFSATIKPDTLFVDVTAGSEKFSGLFGSIRLASDLLPTENSYLPNGQILIVNNGTALELGGAPVNNTSFTAAITGAGYTLEYVVGGNFVLGLDNNELFSGTFSFQNIAASGECSAVTFTAPTGPLNSAEYAFQMNCNNGITQRIVPIPQNPAFYTSVADAGIEVKTDKNTGIITVPGVGSFKSSFFVKPATAADTTFYNANKDSNNVAFRATDANGDGKTDFEVISENGVQLLYGL